MDRKKPIAPWASLNLATGETTEKDVSLTGNFGNVLDGAINAFYAHIAAAYPEAKEITDCSPGELRGAAADALTHWLGINVPGVHTNDEDCERYIHEGTCAVCNVYHDAPCADCGQRAFHQPHCPALEF